ncbi:MAG: hypothetical protein ACRD41_11470, partial [Candidatus Acidiferrales bacterium]
MASRLIVDHPINSHRRDGLNNDDADDDQIPQAQNAPKLCRRSGLRANDAPSNLLPREEMLPRKYERISFVPVAIARLHGLRLKLLRRA